MAELRSLTATAVSRVPTASGVRHSRRMLQESFKLSLEELDLLRELTEASPFKSRGAVLRELIRVATNARPRPAHERPSKPKRPPRGRSAYADSPSSRLPPHPEMLRNLVRVGNLVNQVARGIHAARHQGTLIDVVILHFMLVVIRLELENLRDRYTEGEAVKAGQYGQTTDVPPATAQRAAP